MRPQTESSGQTIWITGLSGSGKTTLAVELTQRLRALGEPVVMLDGDELRAVFGADGILAQNHSRERRLALAMQYARLCRLIANQGLIVVIATISLFKEVHAWNRANLNNYFELYLKVPVEELRRRDPKGLYRKFDDGEIANVAGFDLAIDKPESADWAPDLRGGRTVAELMDELMNALDTRKRK